MPRCARRHLDREHDREIAWLGLVNASRLAGGEVAHKALDIIAFNRLHRHPAEQRDDVATDPAAIGDQRGLFLWPFSRCQQPTGFSSKDTFSPLKYPMAAPPRCLRPIHTRSCSTIAEVLHRCF